MQNRKRKYSLLAVVLLTFSLWGCGSSEAPAVSGIGIDKSGKVTGCIIENFEREYYTKDELESMIQEEIDEFTGTHGEESVVFKAMEEPAGKDQESGRQILVRMEYADAGVYSEFNGEELFYGTVAQAVEAGYELDVTLNAVESADGQVDKNAILAMGEKHIIITSENIRITLPGKAAYISRDVQVEDGKTVLTAQEEGYSYILIK